ncbi:MAG: universal stress protein [Candidatus Methylomirabilia bacterium]
MRRILVPLDESLLAESILPVAEEWAKEDEAEVVLLRAVPARDGRASADARAERQAVEEGEAYLNSIAERLERRGLQQVRVAVSVRDPVTAITEAAVLNGVDLIAMATHGRGGLSRHLLGSVAAGVVGAAEIPVLLMRGQSAWKAWATRKVLVPLDGSELSEGILPVVERVAGPRDLTVTLLQVLEPLPSAVLQGGASIRLDEWVAERRRDSEQYLIKTAEPLREKALRVVSAVTSGTPAQAIATYAAQERVDLIVMATHGRSGLQRLVFGSVAEGVLRSAAVPVLLFKRASQPGKERGT